MSSGDTTSDHSRAWAAPLALTLAVLFWSGNFIAGRALRDDVDWQFNERDREGGV